MGTNSSTPDTIVLIHGLWVTPRSWEHWIPHYEARGFRVLAPGYPGFEIEVEALRENPEVIENQTVNGIAHHYESIIRGLGCQPIIMGHSFGGAITQILLDRGCGSAGVAIDSNPPKGVHVPWSTITSVFPVLVNPANKHRAVPMSFEQFHKVFCNAMNEQDALAFYERYHIPAPGGIVFSGATADFNSSAPNTVDFNKEDRAPLLFIGGELDVIMPASLSRASARHYNTGIVAYREFAGRSHSICAEPNWQEVADFALNWALAPTEDVDNVQQPAATA